ncbi:hypothetical protein BC833DRAFT_602779 [Globomyces pollinis-pini]|nr:hypothetical protein BC833DRAFT_602779 [Globomyces pollinis-pini]
MNPWRIESNYSLATNIVIKSKLPKYGIVCSNPQRARRLANKYLQSPKLTFDSWGIEVYISSDDCIFFIAAVPVGAGGSAFAFHQMYVAGAEYLVRYGSNDRKLTNKDLKDILVVQEADNIFGLMRATHYDESLWGAPIPSSESLFNTVVNQTKKHNAIPKIAVCHHVEDYHTIAFPDELPIHLSTKAKSNAQDIENRHAELTQTWDMESAALFLKAKQFGKHAVTVLQNVLKHTPGLELPYEGHHGETALEMEDLIFNIIKSSFHNLETGN